MITVANRIYVNQEYRDAFEQRFRERAGLVDQMPGFISNHVLRPVNEGDPYVVFTFWNSRQDFLNWVRSDEFVKGHAQSGTLPKDAYFKTNILELHEVLQDSIDDMFVKDPNRSKRIDIKLERLQLDAKRVWNIVDLDRREVGKIGERTDRRKLRTCE